jgi:hypothetical protein
MTSAWLVAAFLLAHAAIHGSFLAPRPPVTAGGPAWPFELERSWILRLLGLDAQSSRVLGIALVAATIGAFALAAVTAIGFGPDALWQPMVTIGAIASLAVLGIYFNPWFVLGIAIDLVLLWGVLIAGWAPDGVSL